jgi:oligopeptide/dipeptide ABC transporter ATP-binding protein
VEGAGNVPSLSEQSWNDTVSTQAAGAVLQVDGATKLFRLRSGGRAKFLRATDGVSLAAAAGTTVGIVGESGCGKTTLGRMVAGLVAPTAGTVRVRHKGDGDPVNPAVRRGLVQMIYQNPADSLDPRLRVGTSVAEPLITLSRPQREAVVDETLSAVGMSGFRDRYPHELSGGQQQRVCIARAIVAAPSVVVLDEAVSALDVLLQIEVLALLGEVQARTATTYLFISHDLAAVRAISDYILVMYLGQVVEVIPKESYQGHPLHPYTVALNSAELGGLGGQGGRRIVLRGEPPSAAQEHPGCRFASRCPAAEPRCSKSEPGLVDAGSGHFVACYFPGALSEAPQPGGGD